MKFNLKYFFSLLLLSFECSLSFGQVSDKTNLSDDRFKGIIYRKETTGDIRLYNYGFSLGVNFGDIKTYYRTNYYLIDIGTMHDDQEYSQTKNINIIDNQIPKKFKFGKQNSALILRAGRGTKKYLTDKAKRKGVSIGYNLEFGPAIAILKPNYLNFIEQTFIDGEIQNNLVTKKYSEETEAEFKDYYAIYGGAPFSKGLKELSFVPGAQAKLGLFFSVGAFDEYVKAAEIGVMADAFIKKMPIMVETNENKNTPVFLNLYVNLHFGKRSN
jgi:hypothetical protein